MLLSTLCVSVFDQLSCPVCLISQLRYVAGLQTEHVLAWLKLNAALHLPLRILCNVEGAGRGRNTMKRCGHLGDKLGYRVMVCVRQSETYKKYFRIEGEKKDVHKKVTPHFLPFVKHYITWKVLHKRAIMILRHVLMYEITVDTHNLLGILKHVVSECGTHAVTVSTVQISWL